MIYKWILDTLYGGKNYNEFDTRLLARCLVAVAFGQAIFPEKLSGPLANEDSIIKNWEMTRDAIERVVNLIRGQFNLFGLRKLPSVNALVPIVIDNVHLVAGDALQPPFRDEQFDSIESWEGLGNIVKGLDMIGQAYRMLREDGWFVTDVLGFELERADKDVRELIDRWMRVL